MCFEPAFPSIEGIKVLDTDDSVPAGMTNSDERYYDVVTGGYYRVVIDASKVSVVGWSTYDFGPLPEGLKFIGPTGLGGYDLYYKAA